MQALNLKSNRGVVKRYGPITNISIVDRKTGKTLRKLVLHKSMDAASDMLIQITASDDRGRRVTFFMKKV
jgi:hypothetical protein